jgi:regulator of replication initiation timing
MKKHKTISMLTLAVMIYWGGTALGQREGAIQGVFVRLAERSVADRVCAAMVVKPFTQDDHLEVLVPQEPKDLAQVARRLRPGHQVRIDFVLEGGHRWLRGLDAQWQGQDEGKPSQERIVVRTRRRDDASEQEHDRVRVYTGEREHAATEHRENATARDRPRESTRGLAQQLEQLGQQFRRLAEQVSRMERDMQALRAENERLRRLLGERRTRDTDLERRDRSPERNRELQPSRRRPESQERRVTRERASRDRAARPALPDSLAGFQGVLTGIVARKVDRGFVLKLKSVKQVWEQNKAENPEAALGKTLVVLIRPDQEQDSEFIRTLRTLRPGQGVLVEAFHLGGEHLTVVEQLQALD